MREKRPGSRANGMSVTQPTSRTANERVIPLKSRVSVPTTACANSWREQIEAPVREARTSAAEI